MAKTSWVFVICGAPGTGGEGYSIRPLQGDDFIASMVYSL
jgi:hypothetical protein